ncbi:MAG: replication-associated recombination protein A [Alphaproteobacteria bacterium]|nr:replication-associated recombination protein A [Alphaproteobacteria bacterium]
MTGKIPGPLADQMRPLNLELVLGQGHIIGEGRPLTHMLSSKMISSIILWGPPGCGKTTMAKLIASAADMKFVVMSAIGSGVAELRQVFQEAESLFLQGKKTLLFVDEIHRFNRSQQDSFLPYMEKGSIVLIGATTENPSFELNSALLSRAQVLTLKRLQEEDLAVLLERAESHVGKKLPLSLEARQKLCQIADGDGRGVLNMAEILFSYDHSQEIDSQQLMQILQKRAPLYDKGQEGHYNLISALHKSLRGSDVDAALYWFARMLEGGELPLYIARRLVRFAAEDIGMADPQALVQANAGLQAYHNLGSPEGELALAQVVVYLATAPKSNAVYAAFKAAGKTASAYGSLTPPEEILNAPNNFMKKEGYGKGYVYDHDTQEGFSGQNYFPKGLKRQTFYHPVERGFERDIIKRLEYWNKIRLKKHPSS